MICNLFAEIPTEMAEWVTIYDNGPGEVADIEQSGADTEESRLYSLRVAYHKALSTLNMSSNVGDSYWEQAKLGLVSASTGLLVFTIYSKSPQIIIEILVFDTFYLNNVI